MHSILLAKPQERLEKLLSKNGGRPFVESYWESYLSFPYDYSNCYQPDNPNEVNEDAYGYDLASLPYDKIDVINIAFAFADEERYLYCGVKKLRNISRKCIT